MTAAEAFYRFWGQFGFPASEEGSVPDTDPPGYPLLVCRYGEGAGRGEAVGLSVSLWVRSTGWREAQEAADRIGAALPPGGVFLPFEDPCEGALWLTRDTPWLTRSGDDEDPLLKRILFRLTARVYKG